MIKFAAIFPGQGIKHINILSDLYKRYKIIQQTFDNASNILGYNLWHLIKYGPQEKLNITYYAQPAILTTSIALYKLWIKQSNCMPQITAGHSLGEYSALVCSKVINFHDAIRLVELRGKLMDTVTKSFNDYHHNGCYMQVIIGLKKK
ncbi:ACP S-malonyltransferase [Enterobacteriaceae endosymbiont of Neohaemonia nigricornis]|uniref:ACP S-malonyltransferase n=1 Tax=Enterobacteriaceae endosymbiont of Neohaemonia nigricornis TaxID=2675792 RepID=UPI001448D623|nr:acyltransferase domain-containing protein [Enterobacteriaceae endosymbiont of Neohaemonia nigricornis]QJC30280.1 acyltransferase domain-containing protein [Enterobacteriaceae endosymbiont of Neohaemonia nigricornis]